MGLKDKVGGVRRNANARLSIIIVLLIIVAVLFYFWKSARIALAAAFIALLAGLGLEITGTDFDIQKLFQTGSFEQSKVEKKGNTWLIGEECTKDKMNCANFTYREDAQDLFNKCGGTENDINGLDGDKDGTVCESLPSNTTKK
jgi:hypothetical protein